MSTTTTSAPTSKPKRRRRMAREPQATSASGPNEPDDQIKSAEQEAPPAEAAKQSKIDKVLALLKYKEGATLDELVTATGWLPHTTRAALTGLRKKGHTIERTSVDGVSRYAIVEVAPA